MFEGEAMFEVCVQCLRVCAVFEGEAMFEGVSPTD